MRNNKLNIIISLIISILYNLPFILQSYFYNYYNSIKFILNFYNELSTTSIGMIIYSPYIIMTFIEINDFQLNIFILLMLFFIFLLTYFFIKIVTVILKISCK